MTLSPFNFGYKMTLKQRRFKLAIKKGAKTIAEARALAGYSLKSRTVYQNRTKTHQLIDEALPKEELIENDFVIAKGLALKNNDLTNFNRSNENLARIKGMFIDKSEITNKNPDKIVIAYGNNVNKPVDNPTISTDENVDKQ